MRLEARRDDPLKTLKISALDGEAQKKWKAYSKARNEMLTRTHTAFAPWTVVRNNHKKRGRLNLIRHLLHAAAPTDHCRPTIDPRPTQTAVFAFEPACLTDGRLAP